MAAVYKSLSKKEPQKKEEEPASSNGVKKNKQRVLILSSRGITYRYVPERHACSSSRLVADCGIVIGTGTC